MVRIRVRVSLAYQLDSFDVYIRSSVRVRVRVRIRVRVRVRVRIRVRVKRCRQILPPAGRRR